eukprot:CAMPEP_0183358504 /NCGR_PEP_ID=MMETSP0164_2-20130417/49502_1 /TAXON_ID=221442 /ORGANISM="Coccolithus pelagicus ssp braarudi, Strain PLY182g" /LENGTH=108 /DNA_ID=CAMNT_0025532413 /DNA_START=107 /DNA_END=429 /DNA_ORIENTATION=+
MVTVPVSHRSSGSSKSRSDLCRGQGVEQRLEMKHVVSNEGWWPILAVAIPGVTDLGPMLDAHTHSRAGGIDARGLGRHHLDGMIGGAHVSPDSRGEQLVRPAPAHAIA